jgi:hypothetical protein
MDNGSFEHRRDIRQELVAHFSADDFKKTHQFLGGALDQGTGDPTSQLRRSGSRGGANGR